MIAKYKTKDGEIIIKDNLHISWIGIVANEIRHKLRGTDMVKISMILDLLSKEKDTSFYKVI